MRIAIDARLRRATGVGRYVTALLERVSVLDAETQYVAVLRSDDPWRPAAPNVTVARADWRPYSWQEQVRLPRLLERASPDLVHFPHFTVPLAFRGRFVVTVHDLTLLTHRNVVGGGPNARLAAKQRLMDVVVGRAVRRAAAVLTVSEHVRDELARRYRIDGASVVVTPNAAPDAVRGEASTARFGLDGRYVLYVGNLYPYKNVTAVVDALARLPADCGDVTLVVVGALDEFAVPVRDAARAAGVEDRLVMTGHVSDAELASLYRGAALFVFPSLSEGFGLPGIEAMAHGVPVAAARASSLPETFGDAAAWFDPRDAGDIAVTLARLLRDPGERARLTTAGRRRVAALSWDRTAAATLAAYRRALGASPSAATAGPSS